MGDRRAQHPGGVRAEAPGGEVRERPVDEVGEHGLDDGVAAVGDVGLRRWFGGVGEDRVVSPDREQFVLAGGVFDAAHDQPGGDPVGCGRERGVGDLGDLGVGDPPCLARPVHRAQQRADIHERPLTRLPYAPSTSRTRYGSSPPTRRRSSTAQLSTSTAGSQPPACADRSRSRTRPPDRQGRGVVLR